MEKNTSYSKNRVMKALLIILFKIELAQYDLHSGVTLGFLVEEINFENFFFLWVVGKEFPFFKNLIIF